MKKLLSLLLVLVLLVGLFSACGNTEEKDSTSTNETTSNETSKGEKTKSKEATKLVIALNKMPENENLTRALEEIQTYEKYSHVEFEILPPSEDFNEKLPIEVASGEQRDLVALANPIIQQTWVDAGVLQPIDQYIDQLGLDFSNEYGKYAENAISNGETFSIPHALTKWALYYNKSIFDAAGEPYPDTEKPMTWDEYSELAARLTSGEGSEKIYGTFHLTWPMFWYGEAIMKLGGGDKFYNEEGLSNIEDPIFAKALERTYKMQHVDKSTQSQADLVSSKTTPTAFMNGKYGMTVAGPWMLSWATDPENYPRDWEIGIAPMPVDSGTTTKTWGIVNSFGIPITSGDPELAVEVGVEITRLCAKYAKAQEEANRTIEQKDLFIGIGEQLEKEGVTTEIIVNIFTNPETQFVTEKVTGPNNVAYEKVIKAIQE